MTASSFDWDAELPPETATEVYQALLRGLQRKQGFGLFFVQCSPDQGERLVADLRRDLPRQRIVELPLQGEVVTLYDQVAQLWQQQPFDVLVLQGLQASIYAYEDASRLSGWSSSEIYQYSWKGVPHILNHLNQQRERFRNDFPARFVFLVPPFVVDYFIQRAADFLDWCSGLFCFPRDPSEIAQEVDRFVGGNCTQYLALRPQERLEKILELKNLQDLCPDSERKASLLSELGLLFAAEQDYENALISWDRSLELNPDDHLAWYNRGNALSALGRYEEAIASYERAVAIHPDYHEAWYSKACCYGLQGKEDLAIESLQHAISLDSSNRELAKTDADFDPIRANKKFQALIQG